jgi:hypothetical protein
MDAESLRALRKFAEAFWAVVEPAPKPQRKPKVPNAT